ncbi:HPP family protein [Haladaptatus pallidirubidus]|uniref:HPP transmembrane region domain-containing protein n=1 Tax=Haladaptatus pallidirubidus TaxID=1008152 RepID=A0AAV3UAI7_9EURY|nr:HPP family protein [Haladaptatus pallidirubidus]
MDRRLATSVHTGLLIAVLGAFAWVTGFPMLFPSLGPSAFVLAMFPDGEASDTHRVVVGHAIGVVAGLFAYHLFAGGVTMTTQVTPLSMPGFRLAASGCIATVLTVGGMLALRVRHPPACATTLIVALGLLSSPAEGATILVAVVILVGVQSLILSVVKLTEQTDITTDISD